MPKDREEEGSGFVVNDRRKFTPEGEMRSDAADEPAPAPAPAPARGPQLVDTAPAAAPAAEEEQIPEPTAEEHAASADAYQQSNAAFDRVIEQQIGAERMGEMRMTFERLIGSIHMTGLMQLGLIYQRDQQPQVDIMGARQSIDTMALLQEKTKGNVSDDEAAMLRNGLYELRMAYLETANAIARQAQAKGQGGPGGKGGPTIVGS